MPPNTKRSEVERPSELKETTPDFRLSLLDADEHLDIKINRFGGSTTPAICGKHVLHWGWIVLDGTRFGIQV